jgi:hypothetical protein
MVDRHVRQVCARTFQGACCGGFVLLLAATVCAQPPSPPPGPPSQTTGSKAAPIERLGPNSVRVGNVVVDQAKKEISVRGVVNETTALEFIAVAKGGFKAYESVFELDTSAVNFNFALILIGLDPARASPPGGPGRLPKGDPVEIWIEWEDGGKKQRVRAEQLIINTKTNTTLSEGPWVYTGSVFLPDSNAYLAEVEGSLIGFVHKQAPVIENPRPFTADYYAYRLNPALKLRPGMTVSLTVRALPIPK